jgi:phage-related protein
MFDKWNNEIKKTIRLEIHAKKEFEMMPPIVRRVDMLGAWRIFYAYLLNNIIMLLSCFNKKSQNTPKKQLIKALRRLNNLL